MVPYTRRHLLHVAVAGISGFAGCGQLTGGTAESTQTVAANGRLDGNASNVETNPPAVLLRTDTETPPIRPPDFEQEQDDESRQERFSARITNTLISSQSNAEQVTVTGSTEREAVSAFVAKTDFDSETLYLETNQIQECYRLKLCHIAWYPKKIKTDYTRKLRPYDEHCSAGDSVFESRLIRLPVALDDDSITSYASSIGGSGQCGDHGTRPEGPSGRSESAGTSRARNGSETQ